MRLIGVVNTEPLVKSAISRTIYGKSGDPYLLRFYDTPESFIEFLNYELPDMVVFNFTDRGLNVELVLDQLRSDPWLNAFAIVGIYSREVQAEAELLERLQEINLVNLLEVSEVENNLIKTLRIADDNQQILFRRDITDKLVERISGSYEIDNDPFAVSCYSNLIVICLFNNGFIDQKTKNTLHLVLVELIMNGIEHGNCKITYEEKSRILNAGGSINDIILQKCGDPAVADKRVHFEYDIAPAGSHFKIRDEGEGFDWRHPKNPTSKDNLLELHGRGILMARHFLPELVYNDKGNEVHFRIDHLPEASRGVLAGFAGQETVVIKPGETVFTEGEESNFLYYIASGRFNVFHGGRQVGALSPADIFVGEMSFLLNNRRSATVKAETEGRLVKISKKTFVSVIKAYPHYGIYLSKLLAQKLVRANQSASASDAAGAY